MRRLFPLPRWRLDCMNPVPAITLNVEAFKQVMAFSLLALPVFVVAGLGAWRTSGGEDPPHPHPLPLGEGASGSTTEAQPLA